MNYIVFESKLEFFCFLSTHFEDGDNMLDRNVQLTDMIKISDTQEV